MARRSSRRRFRSGNKEMVWISEVFSTTLDNTGTTTIAVVPANWERTATSGETCTVKTVLGSVSWVLEDAAVVANTIRLATLIAIQDEDAPGLGNVAASANVDQFENEKAMFSHMAIARTMTATLGNETDYGLQVPFATRARRKLTSGQQVTISVGTSSLSGTANIWRVNVFSRTLLELR